MKNLKHAKTNYKMLAPFVGDMLHTARSHKRYTSGGFMPLVVEKLHYNDHAGNPVYSITHYGEQNGDLMCDPDMTFSVNEESGTIEPQTFQNDYMGMYQTVYKTDDNGRTVYHPQLRIDLDEFLWQWLKNIQLQEYHLSDERA